MRFVMSSTGPELPRRTRAILLVPLLMIVAACTSVEFENTADRLPWSPRDVAGASGSVSGTVVWGGRIVAIENLREGTEFQVLALPLDSGNVPDVDASSIGRFIAYYPGYLEPEDYAPGRYVSLAGRLDGRVEGSVGESPILLPYVRTAQVHLWPRDLGEWNNRWSVGVGVGIDL
ncbi:MAG: Slp family lipoprotein [Deinococcales bacterium]